MKTDDGVWSIAEMGQLISRSSEMKRWFGDDAESMGPADLNKFFNELDRMFSKIESYGPQAEKTLFDMTVEAGLARDGGVDSNGKQKRIWRENKTSPYWMSRYKMLALVLFGLIAIDIGKRTEEIVKEEFGRKK